MKKQLVFLFLFSVILVSCGAPVAPESNTINKVNNGSTFTYNYILIDTAGALVPGSQRTVICTVLQTNLTKALKSGVFSVEEQRGTLRDTSYYVYTSDERFSVLLNPGDPARAQWLELPVIGGIIAPVVITDSISLFGETTIALLTTTASDLGAESLAVGSQNVNTRHIGLVEHEVWTRDGVILVDGIIGKNLNFAPSLGFIIAKEEAPFFDADGMEVYGSRQWLVSYNLK